MIFGLGGWVSWGDLSVYWACGGDDEKLFDKLGLARGFSFCSFPLAVVEMGMARWDNLSV